MGQAKSMSTPKKRQAELVGERPDIILAHLRNGLTAKEIAEREGLDVATTGKTVGKLRELHPDLPPEGKRDAVPFGLTVQSQMMRTQLGYIVDDLRRKYHQTELAKIIGMTNAEQRRASPYKMQHDWKLSQLERVAAELGLTFEQLMQKVMYPPKIGF